MDNRGELMSDVVEFTSLYDKAKACNFFKDNRINIEQHQEQWYQMGIARPHAAK